MTCILVRLAGFLPERGGYGQGRASILIQARECQLFAGPAHYFEWMRSGGEELSETFVAPLLDASRGATCGRCAALDAEDTRALAQLAVRANAVVGLACAKGGPPWAS